MATAAGSREQTRISCETIETRSSFLPRGRASPLGSHSVTTKGQVRSCCRAARNCRHRTRPASSPPPPPCAPRPLPVHRARPRPRPANPALPPPAARFYLCPKYAPARQPEITSLPACASRWWGCRVDLGGWAAMGGPSRSDGRRCARRSCRTGGGGGVVRRTVAAPAPASGVSTARRRTEGFAHVDKRRRVSGVLSDFRCSTGSTTQDESLSEDVGEFKHKSSHTNSVICVSGAQTNIPEIVPPRPSVIAELHDFDGTAGTLRHNKISTSKEMPHARSNVSGLPAQPRYRRSNSAKNPPTVNAGSSMSDFRHQLLQSAERSASTEMSSASAYSSLSEKMLLLRQPQQNGNFQSRNRTSVLNRRHRIVNARETNLLSKENIHEQPDFSFRRHSKVILDNALVRQNQLCCSEPLNQKIPEQSWSSTCSSTSCESVDDFQVSSSSDSSSNSSLSSLGVVPNDQWRMTFKKVHCPFAAHLESTSVIYRKEIGQGSPVSVLEPLSEDCSDSENIKREPADPYDLHQRLELVKSSPSEITTDASSTGGTSDFLSSEMELSNEEAIELVEDILEEFEDEEERDFSYLLDILIASGIHGSAEDQMYKVCQSLDCPAGYDVFEKLEKKYSKVVQWSISDRKLLFDMVNTILSQILAPCLNMQPWVNTARNLAPLWGSEGLLEKVLQVLTQKRKELVLCRPKPEKKAFDQWPDLAYCIDRVGRDIEKMIKDDLLEELFLELLSS